MAVPIRLSLALLLVCSLTLVVSFNLEPRIPVIKTGSPNSHFGYTVAQHQTFTERFGSIRRKSWLLVGAPKGRNLQPGTNRSGALYKCPLTTLTDDCQQVHTDGFKNVNGTLLEPSEDEIKEDQWLGVTLKSQGAGGKVLVCAHRYIHKGPGFQWGFGLCYILSQSLDVDDYMVPCKGKPVGSGHQQYGFCQAGTSGLISEDEAVLGVPGPYTWRGTVHTNNISSNFLQRDKTQYFGPVTESPYPVDKYSYLGYSVAAGRFFGSHMSYVGGAPKSNGTGQIVFFSREKIGVSLLQVELILSGEVFASSFGYEMLAVDINGDRKDDLIVGAPFYSKGSASGAIYIYMNNDGGFTQNHPYAKIEGQPGETRFGSSMTSLGDLNHDSYMDVAIGAPYEGKGVIYIFLGSPEGLMKEPAQIIRAEDVAGGTYNAFGYSLSGGMDLDQNGYPDLLTSSFCSDRVLLLRARPIIDIQTRVESDGQLENIDPSKKSCIEDPTSPQTCFSFRACFKMDNTAGTRTGLRLKYSIEERVYKNRPIPRVRFDEGLPERTSKVQRMIILRPEDMGRFQCSTETVYLLDGPRDILRPLRFKMSYEIIQREPEPVREGDPFPDIDAYPILNQQEALKYFEGTFAKDCGNDDICVSDLNVEGRLVLDQSEDKRHYILQLGEQDTVHMFVEVNNTGEPAYQSSLIITHHNALTFDIIESETGSYQCTWSSSTIVQCAIGNPLIETTGPLHLTFRESGQPFNTREIYFTVMANSSSIEKTKQDPLRFRVEVIKQAEIAIIGSVVPEQVFYGGEVVGESAIENLEDIGKEVTHKYVVDNRGPWRVDELQVQIEWPYQVENGKEKGKWLLYMTHLPIVDGVGECEVDESMINPRGYRRLRMPTGPFVEGELESPGTPMTPGVDGGGSVVSVNRTIITTETKTTVKKTNSTRTSSSGDTSTSSSSGTVSSSSSSSTNKEEGSGFDSGRDHGRTQSRFSRKVSSSSHDRSRFNEIDNDGDVIEDYDRTWTSSGTSPDGKTRFHETHRETKKVTVKEDSDNKDIPSGRWGEGGGHRRTHTSSSSSSSSGTHSWEPEERRSQWESRGSVHSGQGDTDNDSFGTHRQGQNWREGSSTRQVESSSHRTHIGVSEGGREDDGYRRAYGEERRTTLTGETQTNGGSTRTGTDQYGRTDTDQYGRTGTDQYGKTGTDQYGRTDEVDRQQNWREESSSHRGGSVYDREHPESWSEGSSRRYEFESSRRQGSTIDDRYDSRRNQESDRDNYDRTSEGHRDTGSQGGYYTRNEGDRAVVDERNRAQFESGGNTEDGGNRRRVWSEKGSDGHARTSHERTSESHRRIYSDDGSSRDYNYRENESGSGRTSHDSGAGSSVHTSHRTSSSWDSDSSQHGNERSGTQHHFDDWDKSQSQGDDRSGSAWRIHYEAGRPMENATYKRVEVDPVTGDTIVYTRRVYHNSNWEEDDDSVLSVQQRDEHPRNRRDLHRVKREKEMIIKPQAVTDHKTGKTLQVVNLKCDGTPTAKCFVFRCNIRNLGAKQSASIRIKSRLWNATLVEDYPRVSYVSIKSRASLLLPDDIREDQDQSDDVDSAETLAYPDLLDQLPPEEVPLWVILVSIFAGLLVLIIIVLILWKLGFFERKRPDPTLSGNLDKDANGY